MYDAGDKTVKRKQIDFTQGNIILELVMFSIPIVLGELFQNLYNSVDTLVVGNFVGKNALAAVSVCATLANLLVGFFNGMSVGSSVVVSRAFGSRNGERLNRSMRVAFGFSVALGVVLSALGILLTPVLVGLAAVPAVSGSGYIPSNLPGRPYVHSYLQHQRRNSPGCRGFGNAFQNSGDNQYD